MMLLALSTSTPRASVALVEQGRVLVELTYEDPRGHAERIFTLIDDALAAAARSRSDLDLVACDIGPGSFTGVRIAVASAKGVALGLGVPLFGVVSLEAMAAHARSLSSEPTLVATAIDAKKDELYVALYDGAEAVLPPSHLPRADVAARLAELAAGRPFVSVVDAPAFADFGGPAAARKLVLPPSAEWVGRIAAARFQPAGLPDLAEVVPLYVRAPDAIPAFSAVPGDDGAASGPKPRAPTEPGPFDMLPAR
jgi:tRNA threonylcarbamoyladenosine biosynthesis protein TsaB